MDGTLIDTDCSYIEAIRLTAERILGEPVDRTEIDAVKRLPGFNNDWFTTWAVIRQRRGEPPTQPSEEELTGEDYLLMKGIFQTYYLGSAEWARLTTADAPFEWETPLIANERRLIADETLEWISERFIIGIATARPRAEAMIALTQHRLARFFPPESVVAVEDAPAEKPDPAPLLELVRRLDVTGPVYVGDTVNDVIAAHAAGMPAIYVGPPHLLPETLLPDGRLDSIDDLLNVLETARVAMEGT